MFECGHIMSMAKSQTSTVLIVTGTRVEILDAEIWLGHGDFLEEERQAGRANHKSPRITSGLSYRRVHPTFLRLTDP